MSCFSNVAFFFLGGGGGVGLMKILTRLVIWKINSLRSERSVQKTQMSKPSDPIQDDLVGFNMSFNRNRFQKCNLIEFG